jgi:hypothetical protein
MSDLNRGIAVLKMLGKPLRDVNGSMLTAGAT